MSVPQLGSSRTGGFSVAQPHLRYRGTRGGAGGGWGGGVAGVVAGVAGGAEVPEVG